MQAHYDCRQHKRNTASANSYLGILRQATRSYCDRARLGRALLQRGRMVNGAITKTYKVKP